MGALSGGAGGGGLWGWNRPRRNKKSPDSRGRNSKPSDSVEANGVGGFRFPMKQAVTASSLALTGDTIAQLTQRWWRRKESTQGRLSEFETSESEVSVEFRYILVITLANGEDKI